MKKMTRHIIPADGKPHSLSLHDYPLFAWTSDGKSITFWIEESAGESNFIIKMQVFRDTDEIPDNGTHLGSAMFEQAGNCLHLYEIAD